MKHYKLDDSLRQALMESADWSKIGVTLEEAKAKAQEKVTAKKAEKVEAVEEEIDEDEELDSLVEQALHTCPLCYNQLEEGLDEDRLLEHLDAAYEITEKLSLLNEEDEDISTKVSETLAELFLQTIDFGDEDDEDSDPGDEA